MMKNLVRRLVRLAGIEPYSKTIAWPQDKAFNEARDRMRRRKVSGIPDDRCYTLFSAAREAVKLDGDFAECGSRYGKSTWFMLVNLGIENSDKKFHVFDSFEGLSAPTAEDKSRRGESVWKPGALAVDEKTFIHNVRMFEHILSIHKGWIPERFGDVKNNTFALVHIDVDLYQPTFDSLDFFYERMTPGGIMICDDYGSTSCPGARKAFDEFFAERPELVIELPTAQAIVVKA